MITVIVQVSWESTSLVREIGVASSSSVEILLWGEVGIKREEESVEASFLLVFFGFEVSVMAVVLLEQLLVSYRVVFHLMIVDHSCFGLEIRSCVVLVVERAVIDHVSGKSKATAEHGDQ